MSEIQPARQGRAEQDMVMRWHDCLPIVLFLFLAFACPTAALAQTPERDTSTLDAITVTGSRIKRTQVETALPVTVIQKQEIECF